MDENGMNVWRWGVISLYEKKKGNGTGIWGLKIEERGNGVKMGCERG